MPIPRTAGIFAICLYILISSPLAAQNPTAGRIEGAVRDGASGVPLESAEITVTRVSRTGAVASGQSDHDGKFDLRNIPAGEYRVTVAHPGAAPLEIGPVAVDPEHRVVDLGQVRLVNDAIKLEQVEVSARRQTLDNSIDRKVYNVGKDLQSAAGSVSDLLQNVPSIQVDIDGNVSLRGNDSVLILIDGKPSTMMSAANRAVALEQMPADSIERIEVVTNPSAKYKPDGTAGIINIVRKRSHQPGYSATARVNIGNDGRYNVGVTGNYNPGKLNISGSFNLRQDDRPRSTHDERSHLDPSTNSTLSTVQDTKEQMRPLSRLAQLGADYNVDRDTKVGVSANYNLRTFHRTSTINNISRDAGGVLTGDYDRDRSDDEWQKTTETELTFQHSFAEEGREISGGLKQDRHWEQEDNHYEDVYRLPLGAPTFDYTLIKPTETGTEFTTDYSQPLPHEAKLETGVSLDADKDDMDFHGGFTDPVSGMTLVDPTTTNRFIYHDHIQALYATYGQPFGNFGVLAGLRFENATIDTDQVTTAVVDKTNYVRVYPTLHLRYNLSDLWQLQVNYSQRVRRPDSDDLNPFPEYQDPYNLRAGNPRLLPEETHSIESGIQYKKDETTYLATVYYRDTNHAFTTVTNYINSTVLLTTQENLSSNTSEGLEMAASGDLPRDISYNFSSNIYRSEVDARNLGYSANLSAIAWSAKLNLNWRASKSDAVQFNTNYTAKRLTPQGYRLPTYIANIGFKHDFADRKTSFVITLSDIFNSLKERTIINTPTLHDDVTRRRSSRIVYAGFVYTFGKVGKKRKDDTMQFDDKL